MKRSFNDTRSLPGGLAEIDYSDNSGRSDSECDSSEYISRSEYNSDVDYYRHSDLPMDNNFNTELHHAAREGDALKCAELLKNHPNAATDTNDLSLIPLDLAATGGHFDACKILLDYMNDEDIYAERPCGHTTLELILMEAVLNENHYKVFETLINSSSNTQLLTPISFSVLLYLAASAGCKRLCEVILTKYPETIEKKNYSYDSPIRIAAVNSFPEIVELLISHMPRQDIIDTFYSDKRCGRSSDNTISYSPFIGSPFILECMNTMISSYITVDTSDVCFSQASVKELHKLLKIYQDLSLRCYFKDCPSSIGKNHQQLVQSFNKYVVKNLFWMKTICKNAWEQHPFSSLNDDCKENVFSAITKICYPNLDVHVAADPILCVGQDNDLGFLS